MKMFLFLSLMFTFTCAGTSQTRRNLDTAAGVLPDTCDLRFASSYHGITPNDFSHKPQEGKPCAFDGQGCKRAMFNLPLQENSDFDSVTCIIRSIPNEFYLVLVDSEDTPQSDKCWFYTTTDYAIAYAYYVGHNGHQSVRERNEAKTSFSTKAQNHNAFTYSNRGSTDKYITIKLLDGKIQFLYKFGTRFEEVFWETSEHRAPSETYYVGVTSVYGISGAVCGKTADMILQNPHTICELPESQLGYDFSNPVAKSMAGCDDNDCSSHWFYGVSCAFGYGGGISLTKESCSAGDKVIPLQGCEVIPCELPTAQIGYVLESATLSDCTMLECSRPTVENFECEYGFSGTPQLSTHDCTAVRKIPLTGCEWDESTTMVESDVLPEDVCWPFAENYQGIKHPTFESKIQSSWNGNICAFSADGCKQGVFAEPLIPDSDFDSITCEISSVPNEFYFHLIDSDATLADPTRCWFYTVTEPAIRYSYYLGHNGYVNARVVNDNRNGHNTVASANAFNTDRYAKVKYLTMEVRGGKIKWIYQMEGNGQTVFHEREVELPASGKFYVGVNSVYSISGAACYPTGMHIPATLPPSSAPTPTPDFISMHRDIRDLCRTRRIKNERNEWSHLQTLVHDHGIARACRQSRLYRQTTRRARRKAATHKHYNHNRWQATCRFMRNARMAAIEHCDLPEELLN